MIEKLSPLKIVYNPCVKKDICKFNEYYGEILEVVNNTLNINSIGYNLYIIDSLDDFKLNFLIKYIQNILKDKKITKDICYVVNEEDSNPKVIFTMKGNGNKFKKEVENIKDLYFKLIYEFYTGYFQGEKEKLNSIINIKKEKYIEELLNLSEEKGFFLKPFLKGFSFIPIVDDREMTEEEYNSLEEDKREKIKIEINNLKKVANNTIKNIQYVEEYKIDRMKNIFKNFLSENTNNVKSNYKKMFKDDEKIIDFLDKMCMHIEKEILKIYSEEYEEDCKYINEVLNEFLVNVLVDNSLNINPLVIYEDDPNIYNLIGGIEYESKNGNYITNVNLIKAGSMLKASEGCLIIKIKDLLNNPLSYYVLKKSLLSNKINFNKICTDTLFLKGMDTESIPINTKVILIGDYETYDILCKYDEDFKRVFKLSLEISSEVFIDTKSIDYIKRYINYMGENKKIYPLTEEAMVEVFRFLSRKCENRNKVYLNLETLNKLIIMSNEEAIKERMNEITKNHIEKIAYKRDNLEKEIIEEYKNERVIIDLKGKKVGQINGLCVIGNNYNSFGKPITITCSCFKGNGNIIDVQKESKLSGLIHEKSINILNGCFNNIFFKYNNLPVDFSISFEQVYNLVEGDSASLGEFLVMISSLSKVPIKQNIAVTGSMNQFGIIQPVGGINEKIEGFFNICKEIDTVSDKAVIIPKSNKQNIVLREEVEEYIKNDKFKIYTVSNIFDAIKITMNKDEKEISKIINEEINKYNRKK